MPAGRPRIYKNVKDLEAKCDEYFASLESSVQFPYGEPPAVNGLALYLGFSDKSTVYDYRDRPEFSHPIKKALTKIELYHEKGLSGRQPTGHIFGLKNSGWSDKREVDHTSKGEQVSMPSYITISDKSE